MTSQTQCLDPNVLAAFIEGKLAEPELESALDHLTTCVRCTWEVRMVAHVERELDLPSETILQPAITPSRSRRWFSAAVAASLAATMWIGLLVWTAAVSKPMQVLVAAAPQEMRDLEPRLSGFPYARLRSVQRSAEPEALDAGRMKLVGAAGEVLARTEGDDSADARHASAIAHLLAERSEEAVARLEKLATETTDARVWSDLGAALYVKAVERADPARFAKALAATDMALRLDPQLPEALFNRALIVERLGLREQARAAWARYLASEPAGGWAGEAQKRLQDLKWDDVRGETRQELDASSGLTANAPSGDGQGQIQRQLRAAAESAALKGSWITSLYLLDMELDSLGRNGDPFVEADAWLMRARVHARIGDHAKASSDVARAGAAIQRIADPALRKRVQANRQAVEGLFASSLHEKVRILTRAIDSQRAEGLCRYLPEMYLDRGRALVTLNATEKAAGDFDAGIHAIDRDAQKPRNPICLEDVGWESAVVRGELFDEALSLALDRRNYERALAYAERERAPQDSASPGIATAMAGTVVIEYAVLPQRLVTFIVDHATIRVLQHPVGREMLSREIEKLTASAAARNKEQFHESASVLYDRLLAPVMGDVPPGDTLVIVPDSTLNAVPFSALVAPDGRFVVENHPVVVTRSAAAYAKLRAVPRWAATPQILLLLGGPSRGDDGGRLFAAQREADAVAAVYDGVSAPGGSFRTNGADADVIHFVGHALAGEADDAALVTFDEEGDRVLLKAREIAMAPLRRNPVVVLAACSTARGSDQAGGTLSSVAQAFLDAGARSVVGTLWPIDDSSASLFFPRLHQNLARGLAPAAALRATQLEWIRRGDAPWDMWAAVQVMGS